MYFKDIVGNSELKKRIINTIKNGNVPHSNMIIGSSGNGALALAIAMARYINCLYRTDNDSCGKCPSCVKYDLYAHPDLYFLFPIINRNSKNICVDDMDLWREFLKKGAYSTYKDWLLLQDAEGKKKAEIFTREWDYISEKFSYRVSEAKKRVLIVWLAEKMNNTLANKLLKMTEEPPENTVIILVSEDEKNVLGTICSRMQKIYLKPLNNEEMEDYFSGQGKFDLDKISLAIHLSGGNMRNAQDFLMQNGRDDDYLFNNFKNIMRATVDAMPAKMKAESENIAMYNLEEQLELVSYVGKMFRECMVSTFDIDEINYIDADERKIVKYVKGCINHDNIVFIEEELNLAIRHLRQNVDSKMVFFDLMLRLTSILKPYYSKNNVI